MKRRRRILIPATGIALIVVALFFVATTDREPLRQYPSGSSLRQADNASDPSDKRTPPRIEADFEPATQPHRGTEDESYPVKSMYDEVIGTIMDWEVAEVERIEANPDKSGATAILYLPPPSEGLVRELLQLYPDFNDPTRLSNLFAWAEVPVEAHRVIHVTAHPDGSAFDSIAVLELKSREDMKVDPVSGTVTIRSDGMSASANRPSQKERRPLVQRYAHLFDTADAAPDAP